MKGEWIFGGRKFWTFFGVELIFKKYFRELNESVGNENEWKLEKTGFFPKICFFNATFGGFFDYQSREERQDLKWPNLIIILNWMNHI